MESPSGPAFKPPPTVECVSRNQCVGMGKKVYTPNKVCTECLKRHDPAQLRIWANGNEEALNFIEQEVNNKRVMKENVESHGRFLCAFEDLDYHDCRWRLEDLNLRGTRLNCSFVRNKGMACEKCWSRHLLHIRIVQYFTPAGLCYEEADKAVLRSNDATEGGDDNDDVEGYNIILS
ncbi:hypothetical protein K469DRAFT_164749 [Zopfia rhizophila CBS 207.26]|uniref:Uncharacterized protein n=1 Tax=Zopfia rhizophila CBS 207.26 TaxID=1314779 RepID=A0A6A6E4Y2_9PEZI|nr:hypothetical protein K469DRAFT_164749 [Zopfia rhizophila CBS 207.26]